MWPRAWDILCRTTTQVWTRLRHTQRVKGVLLVSGETRGEMRSGWGPMEEEHLDYVLVPLGLSVFAAYHGWLLCNILRNPFRTVIGLNARSRHQWVFSMMTDPLKNGVLAVQTIRNNIMASTLLATTAITLSSLIGIFATSTWSSDETASIFVVGNKTSTCATIKRLSISVCFLVAFLCNVQSIRYYAHVSFLITAPALKGRSDYIEYIAKTLNRGSHAWSLGMRAFHISFPLILWIYGPIPMFACCCLTTFILYFLDTTTKITRDIHCNSFKEDEKTFGTEPLNLNAVQSDYYPLADGNLSQNSGADHV